MADVIWVEMRPPADTRVWVNGSEVPQKHIKAVRAEHRAGEIPAVVVELIGEARVHAVGKYVEGAPTSPLDEPPAPYS